MFLAKYTSTWLKCVGIRTLIYIINIQLENILQNKMYKFVVIFQTHEIWSN